MSQLIIFTDLDGTLLDYSTYSFEKAAPALNLLKQKGIPLVICSSKTRKEVEYYRKILGNNHPFVTENGGGIFIPKGYFRFPVSDYKFHIMHNLEYDVISLGAPYKDLREALTDIRRKGFTVKGFGDMTVQEIAGITNLRPEEAAMAKERDFDEPFILQEDEKDTEKLMEAIRSKGFHCTRGRFFHILGNSDKGKAVSILTDFYKKNAGEILSVAVGDSPNDIPMLEKADIPVIVQKSDGNYDSAINLPKIVKARGIGPAGWNEAILKVLSAYRLSAQ
jgi:mannosyl-3-phosphoglycerate phosphatase